MEPQAAPIPPKPPTPQIKNSLVLIMSILLMVAVAIAGLFYFQIQKLSKELSKYQTQASPTPTATPDPTANWKTYTNNYWKISFKYPDTLFKPCLNYAINEKDGIRFWGPDFTCVIGHDILYKIGFVGYDPGKYTEYKKPSSTETITVGGKQAQKKIYIYDESDGPLFGSKQSIEMVIALSNGAIVLQQLGDNLDEQKTFDQILSTFKFLGQNDQVLGIQINTCCSCPTKIPRSLIGTDGWVVYEKGKNYSDLLPAICKAPNIGVCAPCLLPEEENQSKIDCQDPRPEVCTMECIQNPPYICGSDGKSYCTACQACSNKAVTWYEMKTSPCEEQ